MSARAQQKKPTPSSLIPLSCWSVTVSWKPEELECFCTHFYCRKRKFTFVLKQSSRRKCNVFAQFKLSFIKNTSTEQTAVISCILGSFLPSWASSVSLLALGSNPNYSQIGALAFRLDNKSSAIVLFVDSPHSRQWIKWFVPPAAVAAESL